MHFRVNIDLVDIPFVSNACIACVSELTFDLVDLPSIINACVACLSELTCDLVDLPLVIGATVQSVTNVSLTYSCDERHVYTGGQTTVTCTDQGEWPTPNIICGGEICIAKNHRSICQNIGTNNFTILV